MRLTARNRDNRVAEKRVTLGSATILVIKANIYNLDSHLRYMKLEMRASNFLFALFCGWVYHVSVPELGH